ncbi:MAG: hypothetical protein AB2604_02675 [Candidatus Thiodiazotropha taylori]
MNDTWYTLTLAVTEMTFSVALLLRLGKAGARLRAVIAIAGIWLVWLAIAYALLINGFFSATGWPQTSFTLAVALPIIVYWLAVESIQPLRQAVETLTTQDFLRLQQWRALFGVLFFFSGDLPAWFQYVGGLGDIAAGIGAFVALKKLHNYASSERQAIIQGNLVGILDFIVVLNLGVLVVLEDHSPDIMFNLIPLYVVPLFLLLHVYSLKRLGKADS